jgi:hypothetical protein
VIGRLELKAEGLWIDPLSSRALILQRQGGSKVEKVKRGILLKTEWKKDLHQALHLGGAEDVHAAWRFQW